MKSEYMPKAQYQIVVPVLECIINDLSWRYTDLDEIYNLCPIEEKSKFARERAHIHGYKRDLCAAKIAIESFIKEFYGDEHAER